MTRLLSVLFGALFTVATAWSLGTLLFRKVAPALYTWEERLLAFVAGSACLSEIMFALSAARQIHRGLLLALGLATIACALFFGTLRSSRKAFEPLTSLWRWVFLVAFGAFTWYAFFNALAPEHSSDGMAYHLGNVLIYEQAHGFPLITTNLYASLSQGIELLYLFAFEFGRHSAAALVHYSFLIALVFLVLSYGRRIGRPAVGVAGAIFTYTCPVVLRDGTTAYVDVALAAVLFAVFYLLQVWDESRDPRLLVPIGILAGFGYAAKYTGFLAVPYAAGFVAWKLWRARKPAIRPVLVIALLATAMIVPWMVKNWIEVANPVSPLANRIFPNPYVHISFEEDWRHFFSTYDLASRWKIPLEVTIRGGRLNGFLGPLFLLAPVALLALRLREGRQLLFAGLLFACTYFANIGARFLIPTVPFVSLALALAVADLPWLLLVLVAASAISCWPDIYHRYATYGAWGLDGVPVKAALRLQSEGEYLSQDVDYKIVRMMDRVVPPGQRIFSSSQGGQSYLPRELLIGYQSAATEVTEDILWTPVVGSYQPTRSLKFDFSPREIRKLRVVQQGREPWVQWSIAELRVIDGASELPRDRAWRLTAHPNPWEVQLAFDNSPVTRWRSWQPASPGMYVEVDFGGLQRVSSVVVESSSEDVNGKIALRGIGTDGQWITVSEHPVQSALPVPGNLRMAASAVLKTRGIRYVLIKPGNPGADDFFRYPAAWGMTLAGQVGEARLYQIR